MKSRQRGRAPTGLQGAGQRAHHAAAATGARHGKGEIFPIEALKQPLWQLNRTATSPGLLIESQHNRPAADEVARLTGTLKKQDARFSANVECEAGAMKPLELECPRPGQREDVLV